MTCRHYRRLLSPHLDNALEADERSMVLAHLAQCSACTKWLRQLESNRQLLRVLPTAEVTRGMELLLQSRLQHLESQVHGVKSTMQNSQPAIRPWWRRWSVISVGTLATCAAASFFFLSNIPTPPPVPAEEVVSSMDGLIIVLNANDDLKAMYEGTAEEAAPDWYEDLDQWPIGDGSLPRG